MKHPYKSQPDRAFWKRSVGRIHYSNISDIWEPIALTRQDKVATAGSCFAQHLGNNLKKRGARYVDFEPAPAGVLSTEEARKWGFGVFSCRYGNIYTTRQLIQLFDEAMNGRKALEGVWERDGRFFDALRPSVDPVGQESPETVLALRERHLESVRRMFREVDLFVFTMGLTEGWEHREDKTMYPIAPGVLAGHYDPEKHAFHNLSFSESYDDMTRFWSSLKGINPGARMLLTVSPVPLAATASDNHVLVATTHSKSVLRTVASELADRHDDITYFPSYEIISSAPSRGAFFEPDLREVSMQGVDFVMSNFFTGALAKEFGAQDLSEEEFEIICDEKNLDA